MNSRNIFLIPLLLFGVILSSCRPVLNLVQGYFQDQSLPTATKDAPTATWTPIPSSEEIITTIAVTFTPQPTNTYFPYPDLPSLSELTLTRQEVLDVASEGSSHEDSIFFNGFVEGQTLIIFNRTNELPNDCPYDCSKQEIKSPPRVVLITMIRAQDEISVKSLVNQLSEDIDPYPDVGIDFQSLVKSPAENIHIGFGIESSSLAVVTSTGPIALRIDNLGPFGSDGLWEVDTAIAFANLQIEKLIRANIVP